MLLMLKGAIHLGFLDLKFKFPALLPRILAAAAGICLTVIKDRHLLLLLLLMRIMVVKRGRSRRRMRVMH